MSDFALRRLNSVASNCGIHQRYFSIFSCVLLQEIVVGSNMDKIYIVMDYVEHDLKALMETMKQPFLVGEWSDCSGKMLEALTCTINIQYL